MPITRSESREIAREIAREEFRAMNSELKESMREVISEELGESYNEEREFLHLWMKRTNSMSTGMWGGLGRFIMLVVLSALGALALTKMGVKL